MISPKRIKEILTDCLLNEDELDTELDEEGKIVKQEPKNDVKYIQVDSLMSKWGFVEERLKGHEKEIVELLKKLPSNFREDVGGGWTFLNMAMDKDMNQWGEQIDCDSLVALALGVGRCNFKLPREMWKDLPGGVPYLSFNV